jgi:hypothetical protein
MVKFLRAPKIKKYNGPLEKVCFEFQVPLEKNSNSKLTGFEVVDRMVRPVQKGVCEKPMELNGFKYLGVKRTKLKVLKE